MISTQSRFTLSPTRALIAFALLLLLVAAPAAFAQANSSRALTANGLASGPAPASPLLPLTPHQASPSPSSAGNGMTQGITLHGHWTIDVKNPDGSSAQHREFENSLQYDGTQFLTALMSGYGVAGDYTIYFTNATATVTGNPTTNPVCPAPTNGFPYCSIVQNINTQPGIFHCAHYYCVSGLTTLPTFGNSPNFKLSGSITAPQAGSVNNVYVGFNGCNNVSNPTTATGTGTIDPTTCTSATAGAYGGTASGTTLTSPVVVVAGQIIQISVTYTFS